MGKANFSKIVNEGSEYMASSSFAFNDIAPQRDKILNKEEQQKNISIIACMISYGHAGYSTFDTRQKKLFEERIEKIYNNAPDNVKASELMKIVDASLKALPDKHLVLSNSRGNNPFYEQTKGTVGDNFALRNGETAKRYELSSMENNGQTIGIIALPTSGIANLDELKTFSDELKPHIFNADGSEKFDSLVIDIRGNQGGSAFAFEYLSRTLYGNEVQPCETISYRDTKEADMLRHLSGEISKEKYNQRLEKNAYGGENIVTFDMKNYKEKFPAFENGGYKKPIQVLTDKNTASAAESTCLMLRNHPGVTFVGENTSGCYTEVSGEKSMPLPCGYKLKIATKHLTMPNEYGKIETIGFAPDIRTQGTDALSYVLANSSEIIEASNKRLKEVKKNENSKVTIKDQISITDAQYLRALSSGVNEETVRNLYSKLNPEKNKEQKWNYIVEQSKTDEQKPKENEKTIEPVNPEKTQTNDNERTSQQKRISEQMLNRKIMNKRAKNG